MVAYWIPCVLSTLSCCETAARHCHVVLPLRVTGNVGMSSGGRMLRTSANYGTLECVVGQEAPSHKMVTTASLNN